MRETLASKWCCAWIVGLLLATAVVAEPYSIPTSTRLVHGDLTLASGRVIKFTVLEGAMFTVRDAEEGFYLGFTPTIEDEAALQVRFKVFEITEMGPDLHSLKVIDSLPVAKSEPSSSAAGAFPQIAVRQISLSKMTAEELGEMQAKLAVPANLGPKPGEQALPAPAPNSGCCVTCGSTTSCGCAVQDTCGSCCTNPCCGGGGGVEKPPANQG